MAVSIEMAVITATLGLAGIIIAKENKTSEFRQKWIDNLRDNIGDAISYSTSIQGIASDIAINDGNIADARFRIEQAQQMLQSLKLELVIQGFSEGTTNSNTLKFEQQEKFALFQLEKFVEYHKELLDSLRENYLLAVKSIMQIKLRVNKKEKKCFFKSETEESFFLDKLDMFENAFLGLYLAISQGKLKDAVTFKESFELKNFLAQTSEFLNCSKTLLKKEWIRVKRGELTFFVSKMLGVLFVVASIVFYIFDIPIESIKWKNSNSTQEHVNQIEQTSNKSQINKNTKKPR